MRRDNQPFLTPSNSGYKMHLEDGVDRDRMEIWVWMCSGKYCSGKNADLRWRGVKV